MHAYLIIGNNEKVLASKSKELVDKLGCQDLNFSIQKIDEVRNLSRYLKLTMDKKTAIIINGVHNASLESLNAFLKLLEEPQENVYFILTAKSEYKLPPTIISRCQIVRTNTTRTEFDNKLADDFLKMTKSKRLEEISTIRKRENASDYLENLIYGFHKILNSDNRYMEVAKLLKYTQQTQNAINKNGNVSLQLTNFVIKTDD